MQGLIRSRLPCTSCTSSDAMAEYENNYYCFSCGMSRLKSNQKSFFEKLDNTPQYSQTDKLALPGNSTKEIPKPALKWLLSHGVDQDLQQQYGIQYVTRATVYTTTGSRIILNERVLLPCYQDNGRLPGIEFQETTNPSCLSSLIPATWKV